MSQQLPAGLLIRGVSVGPGCMLNADAALYPDNLKNQIYRSYLAFGIYSGHFCNTHGDGKIKYFCFTHQMKISYSIPILFSSNRICLLYKVIIKC